jgi:transposase
VHLGREQTAMCPYCLEEVKPNDPRGKVVCRICGTPHHADCWAITGKCEVPHLQT